MEKGPELGIQGDISTRYIKEIPPVLPYSRPEKIRIAKSETGISETGSKEIQQNTPDIEETPEFEKTPERTVPKRVIASNSLISTDEQKELSPVKKDIEYFNDYKRIQLAIDPAETAFVLTPRMFFEIEKVLPSFTNKVAQSLELGGKTRVWEASPILSILAKSLLEESTKYSTWIAQRISEKTTNNELIKICDLCSGAGITSSKIYLELKKKGIRNVQIHGIDNSVESLSVSYLLFQTQNIPCTLLKNASYLGTIPEDYDGIVLIYADAEGYMADINKDILYNEVVSDNGISYFSQPKHEKVLKDTKNHLQKDAGIYLSSLNPKLTVKLSKTFLIEEILTGDKKSLSYLSRIENGKSQYEISKDGKIRKAMTIETGRQIEFMRLILKKDFLTFVKYMKGLTKATKAAEVLKDEILSPVNEVVDSISEIYEIPKDSISSYPRIVGSPCDVIEVKV